MRTNNGELGMRTSLFGLAFVLMLGLLVVACGGGGGSGESSGKTGDANARLQAASALVEKKDWAGAVQEYTQAIELAPKSDRAYEGRGLAYMEMGSFDLAASDLSKAIQLAPDRGGPYFGRGVAYRKQGKLDLAIADLARAVGDRSKTRWRGALYERGLAYKAKGDVAEARADFERIVRLEEERPGEADKEWVELAKKALAELGQ